MLYGRESLLSRYRFAVNFVGGKRVLDISCGVGNGVEELSKGEAKFIVGVDIDIPSTKYAQETYARQGVDFSAADGHCLPFLPNSFDTIVSLETIEHLENPEIFLAEVCRVMTDEGFFIVSTPNRTVINPGASLEDKPKNKYHLREYSREEFEVLLKQFFDEVELFGLFNPQANRRGNPFVRRMKLLGNLVRLEKVVEVGSLKENKEPSNIVAVCKSTKEQS